MQLQGERELAWCTTSYAVIDAVMVGADYEGKKQPICEKHGYEDFTHMLMDQVRPPASALGR